MTLLTLKPRRRAGCLTALVLGAAVTLAGCGGGGSSSNFDLSVVVAGHPVSGLIIAPGQEQNVYITAGQSIELDASEPVTWTVDVGGSTVTGDGVTVYFDGVGVTQTTESDSRIAVDTMTQYALVSPVPFTFIATSTFDAALVAKVNVFVSN